MILKAAVRDVDGDKLACAPPVRAVWQSHLVGPASVQVAYEGGGCLSQSKVQLLDSGCLERDAS